MLIGRIARQEARDRRAAECSVVVPALKVITGTRCRSQGHVRVEHGVACDRVRVRRRVTQRRAVIQRIGNAVIVCTAPLCIEGLGRRIHGREARDRRAGEGRVVVPALEGITVPERRQEVDIAATVCEHRVAREISRRVGCRRAGRCSVV